MSPHHTVIILLYAILITQLRLKSTATIEQKGVAVWLNYSRKGGKLVPHALEATCIVFF